MKKNAFTILIFAVLTLLLSSNRANAQTVNSAKDSLLLPMLPDSVIQFLWDKCQSIDYIFYDFPASINLDNPTSIRQGIRQIGMAKVSNRQQCKAIGKMFFYVNGNLYFDTDVYFDGGTCAYFVYTRNQQALYANRMSSEGTAFFTDILQRVKTKAAKH